MSDLLTDRPDGPLARLASFDEPLEQRTRSRLTATTLIGSLLVIGGLLLDASVPVAIGVVLIGVAVGTGIVWQPTWMLTAFIVARPVLDLGPTYARGPNLNAPFAAALLATLVSWTVRHRQLLERPSASVWASFAFAATALLSAIGSARPFDSLDVALRVVIIVVAFAVADQLGRKEPQLFRRTAIAVVLAGAFSAIIALGQRVGLLELPGYEGAELDRQLLRPPGPFPAPTVLAVLLVIAVSLLLVIVPRVWITSRKLVAPLMAFAALVAAVLLENKSRSASASLLLVLVCFCIVRWRWVGLLAATIAVLVGVASLDASSVRLDELGSGTSYGENSDTLAWRLEYWRENLTRFDESPIVGIGLGRIEQLHPSRQPPHNTVVQAIVEMGLAGVIAYGAFAFLLARDLLAAMHRTRGAPDADVVLLVSLLCLAYGFNAVFDNLLTQVVTSVPMAILTGLTLGAATRTNSARWT